MDRAGMKVNPMQAPILDDLLFILAEDGFEFTAAGG
jgi:hypothetical protein